MKNRKKIAVNTRFLLKGRLEGIGVFTFETLKRITAQHPEIDFYFLFDRKFDNEFITAKNITPVILFPPARHPFLWYWWFEISVAGWLNNNKPDLFLSTDGYACLKSEVPQVLVMHDLAFEHSEGHVSALVQKYYKYFMPRFARHAARIATVSKYSKNDIIQRYHIDESKIDVVYNGAKEVYRAAGEKTQQAVKMRYADGQNFWLYVGAIHPRKNIKSLLLAFEDFKARTGSDMQLLLAGRKSWGNDELEKALNQMRFSDSVKFLGHVAAGELAQIMASCYGLVYVSLFEGFGIPIVEAMSCEVPVITSKVTSMPEVAGDAALLVNPESVNEISAAMQQLAQNPELRKSLIEKGGQQVKNFSWDLTAEKLWACCEKVLDGGRRTTDDR